MVSAVVLAGYSRHSSIREFNKAMLEMSGKWVIEYVISALEGAKNIDEIVVVGPKRDLEERIKNHKIVDDEGKFTKNCLAGYNNTRRSGYTFFVYSDIPLVTSESIDHIIDCCQGDYDFFIPVARRKTLLKFEDSPLFKKLENFRYLKLADGWMRTANSALVNCDKVVEKTRFLQDVEDGYHMKKLYFLASKLRLFLKLGPKPLFKYFVTKNLTLDGAAEFLTRKTGVRFKFVETIHPETSIDIDDYDDYVVISNYLRNK